MDDNHHPGRITAPTLMNDISIDIETLSTRFDATILSIGAVAFDRRTGALVDLPLYVEVEVSSALAHGHVSGSTLEWWMQQSEEARRLFGALGKSHLASALLQLTTFVNQHPGAKVWGNGATFDITVLEHAYTRLDLPVPWKYWDIRDMRTIVEAATAMGFDKRSVPFEGTRHNAADDAAYQARVIARSWAFCGALSGAALHPDDIAVDSFAAAMKAKMAAARAKGRSGWEDREGCTEIRLRAMLRTHLSKGDPVDVGNFAMMLFARSERTADRLSPEILAALAQANRTGALHAELPDGAVMFINRGHDYGEDPAMPNEAHCTCPSGDGSLAWPCPKHGTAERAAFCKAYDISEDVRIDQGFYAAHWAGWQRRGAPAAVELAAANEQISDLIAIVAQQAEAAAAARKTMREAAYNLRIYAAIYTGDKQARRLIEELRGLAAAPDIPPTALSEVTP